MRDTCKIHARYIGIHVSSEAIKIHAGYMWDTCGMHAGYMRDTCGTRISGVWGNVSMPSWRAAHLSGHPCPPCAEMGPLQHPPAPASSPLSWPDPYPCWSTTHVKREAHQPTHQLLLLHCKVMEARELLRLLCLPRHLPRHLPRQLR